MTQEISALQALYALLGSVRPNLGKFEKRAVRLIQRVCDIAGDDNSRVYFQIVRGTTDSAPRHSRKIRTKRNVKNSISTKKPRSAKKVVNR